VGLSCSFVEPEAKFNASSLLLNSRHFDISRRSWKWCKENSQNSETCALIMMPVARLLVERYKKRHLAAQVHSANGLCSIVKFLEIFGSTTYNRRLCNRWYEEEWLFFCLIVTLTAYTNIKKPIFIYISNGIFHFTHKSSYVLFKYTVLKMTCFLIYMWQRRSLETERSVT
jgi:hypothetical protein